MNTELGKIQNLVTESKDNESKSPLKEKLDEFGETLTKVIGIICIVVWVINYKNFFDSIHGSAIKGCIYYFKISVSLAVAAIPEGLPAVITTCLALGTKRMTENKALIRKLDSIETLGCTTVICSDKTGTLTTNNMTMTKLMYFVDNKEEVKSLSGVSYDPLGEIENFQPTQFENIKLLTYCSSLCNGATIEFDKKDNSHKIHGSPTDAALRVFVEKAGLKDSRFKKSQKDSPMEYNDFILNDFKVLFTLEFDRARKCKSVLALDKKTNKVVLFTKGAFEILVEKCDNIQVGKDKENKLEKQRKNLIISKVNETFTNNALRTLAVCYRTNLPDVLKEAKNYNSNEFLKKYFAVHSNITDIETSMTLLGVVGIKDPPREEVKSAIATCFKAGIRVIMITGDNKLTAEAIAKEVGLISVDADLRECSFQTSDFFDLKQEAQIEKLRNGSGLVFSRSDPKHKMSLVKLLKGLVRYIPLLNL